VGRRGLELRYMWQRRCPSEHEGGVQSRVTHDSVEALSSRKAGSEAIEYVTVLKASLAGGQDSKLYGK
jgi:hypothetical protein